MGLITYVACKTCKVQRDLDKFYLTCYPCGTREDALAMADKLRHDKSGHAFRAALLIGFMKDHAEHDVTLFTEGTATYEELCAYPEDEGFWRVS